MDTHLRFELLEGRFAKILARFRSLRRSDPTIRAFALEYYGTPKAGKTTILMACEHFLKRNLPSESWNVTARPEGAEVVDLPRTSMHYNEQTGRYALSELVQRLHTHELVILDRGLLDTVIWSDYWLRKGRLTEDEQRTIEAYQLLPFHRDLFDLHICMVCDPEEALERELAHAASRKEGETMNPDSLRKLHDAHARLWERLSGDEDPRLLWHDSTCEEQEETYFKVLSAIADAFERRLESIR